MIFTRKAISLKKSLIPSFLIQKNKSAIFTKFFFLPKINNFLFTFQILIMLNDVT